MWSSTDTPAIIDFLEAGSPELELGVRFKAAQDGWIHAIRFYKCDTNTGPHVGNLWTNDGTLLASATFTNETASGWQEVQLPSPVFITAETSYVVSYNNKSGHFSYDEEYFTSGGLTQGPLTALANSPSQPNGVFHVGASAFPTNTYNSSNYWVDVVFAYDAQTSAPNAPSDLAPNAVSRSRIDLSWVENSANETGFKIERKTGAEGSYVQIATVSAGVTTYADTGLVENTTYFYRVRATNGVGDSAYSPEASTTTLANSPPVANPQSIQVNPNGTWKSR